MAVVLAVVLVSLSACVMPKTSRKDLGYTPSHPTKKGDRVERKAVPDQCLDQALGTSCRSRGRPSFRSYAGQVGGGNKGEPVVRESVRGLGRSGRVLARRGGATGEGGLNDSAARGAVGRGRGDACGEFEDRKNKILSSNLDFSPKGSIDSAVVNLLELLNRNNDHYSTSSCSGRITIMLQKKNSNRGGTWGLISHAKTTPDVVTNTINNITSRTNISDHDITMFRFEPLVLAVVCRDLHAAKNLLELAISAGFKESGIRVVKDRIMVTIRTSLRLEAPVASGNRTLVSEEYLNVLTQMANDKLEENWKRLHSFEKSLTQQMLNQSICMHGRM